MADYKLIIIVISNGICACTNISDVQRLFRLYRATCIIDSYSVLLHGLNIILKWCQKGIQSSLSLLRITNAKMWNLSHSFDFLISLMDCSSFSIVIPVANFGTFLSSINKTLLVFYNRAFLLLTALEKCRTRPWKVQMPIFTTWPLEKSCKRHVAFARNLASHSQVGLEQFTCDLYCT